MKKILFSLFFVATFGTYALIQRANEPVVAMNTETPNQAPSAVVAPSTVVVPSSGSITTVGSATYAPSGEYGEGGPEQNESGPESGYDSGGTIATQPTQQPVAEATTPAPVKVTPKPRPVATPKPTPAPVVQAPVAPVNKIYKDGTFTGAVIDAYYGNVQVQITTKSDRIVDVQFLDYPHDRNTSVRINSYATPILVQEAISAQSAQVNAVSGASATSGGFVQSLSSALAAAHV